MVIIGAGDMSEVAIEKLATKIIEAGSKCGHKSFIAVKRFEEIIRTSRKKCHRQISAPVSMQCFVGKSTDGTFFAVQIWAWKYTFVLHTTTNMFC